MLREFVVAAGVLAAMPAVAGEMTPEEARSFVAGKLFSYTCFEGTRGAGRIHADGSVMGTIQIRGSGPVRQAMLPANTIRIKSDSVCASVRGLPFEPCFRLERTSANSFRGSISGLSFASCEFVRRGGRITVAGNSRSHHPLSLQASTTGSRE
ncbi:MAG TPA: hypothetical protein VFB45_10935 [Pseudolabrys sp.]|nr:hypothetical protein [Pseudolabrys sp.]